MPVYNAEAYVAEAVESVLEQTYADFEFVIVDDGSTDGSLSIIESYAGRDERIRLISRPNTGLVGALNDGLAVARGELVARMDADDICLPERFERQLGFLRENASCVLVGCHVKMIDSDGDVLGTTHFPLRHGDIEASLFMKSRRPVAISHPTAMMRRDAVIKAGNYRPHFAASEDRDLWLRLAEHGELANLDCVLLKYRLHEESFTNRRWMEQREWSTRAIMEAYDRRGLARPSNFENLLRDPTNHVNGRWAKTALANRRYRPALKHLLRQLRRKPFSRETHKLVARFAITLARHKLPLLSRSVASARKTRAPN